MKTDLQKARVRPLCNQGLGIIHFPTYPHLLVASLLEFHIVDIDPLTTLGSEVKVMLHAAMVILTLSLDISLW